jgi:aminoglycoside N3'-acetyltransferase
MGRLQRSQFRRWFEEVLLPSDDLVVVYSGIWTFGNQFDMPVRDVPRMIIELMLEAVGPSRTLLLPSYTYNFTGTREYSPKKSIPETGVLPQVMWKEFSCKRTTSALNSFLAIGPKDNLLTEISGETLWGNGSLKEYFERSHARMVTLGLPWKDSLGFLHRIEEAALVPYRYHKTFHGHWLYEDGLRPWTETMFVRSTEVMPIFDWSSVDRLMRNRSQIISTDGPIFIESADATEIVKAGLEIIKDDAYGLLVNPREVRQWVENHKFLEIARLRDIEPRALEWFDENATFS